MDLSEKKITYSLRCHEICKQCNIYISRVYEITEKKNDKVKRMDWLCVPCIRKMRFGTVGKLAEVFDKILEQENQNADN